MTIKDMIKKLRIPHSIEIRRNNYIIVQLRSVGDVMALSDSLLNKEVDNWLVDYDHYNIVLDYVEEDEDK